MSLAQVADAQISSSYLSKIERDQSDITVTKLAHLLERLSTTPEEFLFLVTAGREHDYATRDRLLGTYFGQTLELSADPKDFPKAIQVMKEEISRAQAAFDRHPNLKQQLESMRASSFLQLFNHSSLIKPISCPSDLI